MSEIKHIIPHKHNITKKERSALHEHKPVILWFAGLSGSGKSTLANLVEQALHTKGYSTYILDGDNIRMGLCKDLGFGESDRKENIRRIGEVAKLFVDAGTIVLTAFISPFKSDRQMVRDMVASDEFMEIFVDAPIEVCEQRDVKGLYKKARNGEIKNFTGIDSPFEAPVNPDVHVLTHLEKTEDSVQKILNTILPKLSN